MDVSGSCGDPRFDLLFDPGDLFSVIFFFFVCLQSRNFYWFDVELFVSIIVVGCCGLLWVVVGC